MTTNATNHEQAVIALLGDIRQKLVEAVTAGAHGCGDPLQYALGVMAGWDLPDAAGTAPSGYAYRYPDGYIRFSNGETINGSSPTESIPYFFGAPPASRDNVLFNGFDIAKLPSILISCVARLWPGSQGMFWEAALERMPGRIEALMARQAASAPTTPNVKDMVNRFLCWKLPKSFNPDCGVSFKPADAAGGSWPIGTNLLTAIEAKAMFEHCLAAPISEDTTKGFPERDQSKPAEQQGMFRKFDVRRTDGSSAPGGKHHDCEYFVLDLTHDAHAGAAMLAYAESCAITHPVLSDDIMRRVPAAGRDAWRDRKAAKLGEGMAPQKKPTLEKMREMLAVQGGAGNWDHDHYMHGMYNGMEYMLAMLEDREPEFRSAPAKWICERTNAARTPASLGSEAKGEAAASIGDDAEFRALAILYLRALARDRSSAFESLVAYIDSRIAAEVSGMGKALDLANVALANNPEIEALKAKFLAPERSGKAADVMKALTDACDLAMKNAIAARIPECADFAAIAQNLDWALGEMKNSAQPTPASNSSAAPSDIAGLVVRDVCELSYEGEFNPETMMVVSAEDLTRIVTRHALAAPAPTGESLADAACALALNLAHVETDAWAEGQETNPTPAQFDGYMVRALLRHLKGGA